MSLLIHSCRNLPSTVNLRHVFHYIAEFILGESMIETVTLNQNSRESSLKIYWKIENLISWQFYIKKNWFFFKLTNWSCRPILLWFCWNFICFLFFFLLFEHQIENRFRFVPHKNFNFEFQSRKAFSSWWLLANFFFTFRFNRFFFRMVSFLILFQIDEKFSGSVVVVKRKEEVIL